MRVPAVLLAATLALAAAVPGRAAAKAPKSKSKKGASVEYRLKEGYFRCQAPAGWQASREEREDRRQKVYGVAFLGPKGATVPRLTVEFYAEGNALFSTAEEYLSRQTSEHPIKVQGESTGKPEEFSWKGAKATRFTRDGLEMHKAKSMEAEEVPTKEEHAVIGAPKGFFVLSLVSARSEFQAHRAAYQRVLDTFEPFPAAR